MLKTKISKILVPLDGSKNSFIGLEKAIYIARQCGSIITGIHVVSIYPQHLGDLITPLKVKLLQDAAKFMEKAKVVCAQNGIVFHYKILYGEAKLEIVDFAKQNKFDLIVIGSKGLHGMSRVKALGSVSRKVSELAKCPVMIIH